MNPSPSSRLDLVDLAGARLGGRVLACSDDFFAEASNLLRPEPALWDAGRYTDHGKWMDGWESRRRRTPGHDWCVIALGRPGCVEQLVIDTAHFTGNHPEAATVHATFAPGASNEELTEAEDLWSEILPRTPLSGGTEHVFDVDVARTITHVRLSIHPDGGVARLRVRGRVTEDHEQLLATELPCDLASLDVGGHVLGCSDAYFSAPANLLQAHPSLGMHDGWETRRRRGPGFDWVVLALGRPGRIRALEVDTTHFKGNAPATCEVQACDTLPSAESFAVAPGGASPWRTILPRAELEAHAKHHFEIDDDGAIRALRFDIHPDGGVARLGVRGEPAALRTMHAGLERLNALDATQARTAFLDCCGSTALADALVTHRPYDDPTVLRRTADRVWSELTADDWREALAAHPEIGASADPDGARAARWSASEQAQTSSADDDLRRRLAEGNRAYRARFGWTYVVCATGRTPREMAALLEHRMRHDPAHELTVAAEEQRRITALRLAKLMGDT